MIADCGCWVVTRSESDLFLGYSSKCQTLPSLCHYLSPAELGDTICLSCQIVVKFQQYNAIYENFVFSREKFVTKKSLGKQLSITLALFLLIGMASVSFVWVTFLHRQMITELSEGLNIKYVSIMQIVNLAAPESEDILSERISFLFDPNDNQVCYGVVYEEKYFSSESGRDCTLNVLTGAEFAPSAKANIDEVTFSGSTWAVFTISHKYLHFFKVIVDGAGTINGAVEISTSLEPIYVELRDKAKMVTAYGVSTILILTSIFYIRIRLLVLRPIANMIDKADGYYSESELFISSHHSDNEFGQLSTSLKKMINTIESDKRKLKELVDQLQESNRKLEHNKREMVNAEKLASVGRLAAGLAHEIGNPLGIVQGYVDMLGTCDLEDNERRQFALRAEQELFRISSLLRQLLDFSRSPQNAEKSRVALESVLSRVVEMVKSQKNFRDILFTQDFGESHHEVSVNENQLKQVLINCLLNAAEAVRRAEKKEQKIDIMCDNVLHDRLGRCSRIIISDNGPGLGLEELKHAFDPFYTTRGPGEGTGLGLYVSYAIVENFGGNISLVNNESCGARVEIILPVAVS